MAMYLSETESDVLMLRAPHNHKEMATWDSHVSIHATGTMNHSRSQHCYDAGTFVYALTSRHPLVFGLHTKDPYSHQILSGDSLQELRGCCMSPLLLTILPIWLEKCQQKL